MTRDTGAPRAARQRVAVACRGWPKTFVVDAQVVTSELVTNAVRHAFGPLALAILATTTNLHVEVSDGSPELPVADPTSHAHAEGGRGLAIVALLATQWGYRAREDGAGKTVWFDLSAP